MVDKMNDKRQDFLNELEQVQSDNSAPRPYHDVFRDVIQALSDNTITADDALSQLNAVAPDWLSHGFSKDKITHRVDHAKFTDELLSGLPLMFTNRYPAGIMYTGKHWEPVKGSSMAKTIIERATIQQLEQFKLYGKLSNQELSKLTRYTYNYATVFKPVEFENVDLINFSNGTLNPFDLAFKPHDPDDHLTHLLPIEYAPGNGTADIKDNLLYRYAKHLLGDELQTLVEWFGYMFFNDTTAMNHIVYIQGTGGNGKTTLLNTLKMAFGGFGTAITFKELTGNSGDRYLDQLATSWANINGEAERYITDDGLNLLKKMTGGESMTANPKGKDTYTFTPRAKHLSAVNYQLPNIPNSKEYQRRMILLTSDAPTIKTMPNEKEFKAMYAMDKLSQALPEFVAYSIDEARQAVERRKLTVLPTTEARTLAWLRSSDIVQAFVDDFVVSIDHENGVSRRYIWEMFTAFANEMGAKTMTAPELQNELETKGYDFNPNPSAGHIEDIETVDDPEKNKRNRMKRHGVKKNK